MDVRPCATAEEMRAAFAPIWHYFGQLPPTEDTVKHFARVLEPQRVHAGFDGDAIVSGSASFPFDLTVPGGQVKAAGVTVIEGTLRYPDFENADEIFSTGNYSKVVPVVRIGERSLQPGPFYRKARELYWQFAHA